MQDTESITYESVRKMKSIRIGNNNVPLYHITIPKETDTGATGFSLNDEIYRVFYASDYGIESIKTSFGEDVLGYIKAVSVREPGTNMVFRGIDFKDISNVFDKGADRIEETGGDYHDVERKTGLKPNQWIYAATSQRKALENTKSNPQVILLYDGNMLENIYGVAWYAYIIKDKGKSWADVLKGIVFLLKNK